MTYVDVRYTHVVILALCRLVFEAGDAGKASNGGPTHRGAAQEARERTGRYTFSALFFFWKPYSPPTTERGRSTNVLTSERSRRDPSEGASLGLKTRPRGGENQRLKLLSPRGELGDDDGTNNTRAWKSRP